MKKHIVTIFLVFFLAVQAKSMTLSSIRSEVRRAMRDTSASSEDQRYSDDTILALTNEAQREIINQTWLSERTTSYILLPRTTYYALPPDSLAIEEVKFSRTPQNTINLAPTTIDDLRRNSPAFEAISGVPINYFVDQATYSAVGSSSALRIAYLPVPTSASTGTVSIVYFNAVDDLRTDSDVPFNGKTHLYTYHMGLVFYVVARLKAIEGVTEEAAIYMTMYSNYIKMIQSRTGAIPGYNPIFNK